MISEKQIKGIRNSIDLMLTEVSQDSSGTVTLTRRDGTTFSFTTGKGEQGAKGIKGEQGDKGDDGAGPYEMAVSLGYSGTELEWHHSLKGVKGDKGKDGAHGKDGTNGTTPYFNTGHLVTRLADTPEAVIKRKLSGAYEVSVALPKQRDSASAGDGRTPGIMTVGRVFPGTAAANISWTDNIGMIEISIPPGKKGLAGFPGTTTAGTSPRLEEVKLKTSLTQGSTAWLCEGGGCKGGNRYEISLSRAAKGLQGDNGLKGPQGITGGKLTPSKITDFELFQSTYNFKKDYTTFGTFNVNGETGIYSTFRDAFSRICIGTHTKDLAKGSQFFRRAQTYRSLTSQQGTEDTFQQLLFKEMRG